eukprot:CAMPEP_0172596240 /NCGR_PEP_ID=MMETSP1068-20121228/16007_1 /TAXON_ID=35684 /ORGANISM="Pseudopedinella elastica, Strain CCMP716" /LENGTH=400 /DNA_ID=CAMNT_0013395185 /DNA_START=56 /DNA_END=1258 /DNA_ORIENTATION=-
MARIITALLSVGTATAFLGAPLPVRPAVSTSLRAPSTRALPVPSRSMRRVREAARDATVMSASSFKVGVVGATGAVGEEIMGVLKKRGFPVSELHAFASERSAGKTLSTPFGDVESELFSLEAVRAMDVVFLAVDGDFAGEWAEKIADGEDGPYVIDNSSFFRYNPKYPLVIPEINGHLVKKSKLIANPNCTTAVGLMALYPLFKKFGLKKMIMSTYQAASGAGAPGMNELKDGVAAYAAGKDLTGTNKVFAYPLPFNLIPQIDKFQENGYTKEEMKVTWETRKILDLPDLPVSCTAVRIPTLRAHAEAITIETELPCPPEEAMAILAKAEGVTLRDDVTQTPAILPMPLTATGEYNIEVGRIRRSEVFGDTGLDFFVCGDQLLRGAALNAVLVAEKALL